MKINTFVVDDSLEFTNDVRKYFKGSNQINLLGVASDGELAINYLNNHFHEVDCIVLDLILPKMDGVDILQKLEKLNYGGHVIVLSSAKKEYMISVTEGYQVDYFMLKPCALSILEEKILSVCKKSYKKSENGIPKVEAQASKLLHELGVPSQIKGYQYLREGIMMLYKSPKYIGGITKELYPSIASVYDTTPSRVERAIRHAIEVSWNRADYELMNKIFGHSIDYDRAKPTNSEFLVTVSDALKLRNKVTQVA